MKFKHTIILAIVAIALWGYVQFVDRKMPGTAEIEARKGQLFTFDRDKISAISIKAPEGKIELKKDGKSWRVEEPVKDRADLGAMNALFTSIELLKAEETINNGGKGIGKDQVKEYGISDSQTKLTMVVDGKPVELIFGKDTAIANRVYAMVDGAKSVVVVSNKLRSDISKKADEFRDRKLSDLTIAQVSKAVIKTGSGEIVVDRKNEHWSIEQPLKARGDDSKIADVISQAISARVDSFVADTSKLAEYGLEQPRGSIALTVEGQAQPQVLSIGNTPKDEKDKEKVYARLSSRDAVVIVPKAIAKLLDTKPNDLRDRKLLQFNRDMVDRVTIEAKGMEKLVFARSGEKNWVRKGDKDEPVNGPAVLQIMDDLGTASVVKFVSDVATELPKYGLDQPELKVTLSAFSAENTAESKSGEKVIESIAFGKIEDSDVYVKLDDEPFIVSTPSLILGSIPTDPIQIRPLEIYTYKPEEIVSFEVSREGQPTLAFERDKDKNWKLAKGDDKIHSVNVQSLVNSLASLRAIRWVGPTLPEHGFEKPTATVSFKTTSNGTGKVTFGGLNADKMRFASTDQIGTFLVPAPDYDSFVSNLTEVTGAAAPGASAGANSVVVPGKPDAVGVTPAPGQPAPAGAKPDSNAPAVPAAVPAPASPPAPVAGEATPPAGEAPAKPAERP